MNTKNEKLPKHIMCRFKWLSNNQFIAADHQGVEKIIDYTNGQFTETATNVIPMYEKEDPLNCRHYVDIAKPGNEIYDQYWLERKYRQYKSSYQLHNVKDPIRLYQDLLSFDPTYPDYVNHSFTYFYWKLIEQLENDEIDVEDILDEYLKGLLFTILPGGNTLMHRLC